MSHSQPLCSQPAQESPAFHSRLAGWQKSDWGETSRLGLATCQGDPAQPHELPGSGRCPPSLYAWVNRSRLQTIPWVGHLPQAGMQVSAGGLAIQSQLSLGAGREPSLAAGIEQARWGQAGQPVGGGRSGEGHLRQSEISHLPQPRHRREQPAAAPGRGRPAVFMPTGRSGATRKRVVNQPTVRDRSQSAKGSSRPWPLHPLAPRRARSGGAAQASARSAARR